jgi:predicted transglutaminase-like cysteine proteinase
MFSARPPAPTGWRQALVLAALLLAFAAPAEAAYPRLFDSTERQASNINMFPKWSGTLNRYFSEAALANAPCTETRFNKCHLADWKRFLDSLGGVDTRRQIDAVNDYMNRQRYLTDPRNYGVKDYWATPGQFFKRNGDCEDYAIAKFMSLRALGVPNDAMRIVVVQDLNLRIGHAVLVVYLEGRALILDNQARRVVDAASIRHYKPVYSINETHWWLHRRG